MFWLFEEIDIQIFAFKKKLQLYDSKFNPYDG